jgi:acyl-homoserine lactone acylase PvdQ
MGFMKHEFTSYDFYFRLNLAHSPNDFIPYKHECILSNYNLHWASKEGQIGYITLGIINLKKYQNRFCHGFSSQDDIVNEIPQDEMLFLTSPKKGYIISGNNSPAAKNYLYKLIGNHNNARAFRVNEILNNYFNNNTKISVNESIRILKDIKDSNAAYILPKYLEIIKRNTHKKELSENRNYQILKKWNFEFDLESEGATLYSLLERNLCLLLLNKKMSKEKSKPLLNFFPYYKFIHGMIDKIYNGEKIQLKECSFYNSKDDCEKYLVNVFRNLDEYTQDFRDSNNLIKKWGAINYNYFPNTPFDDIFLLKNIYSKKKYVSGNKDTIKISRSTGNNKMGEFVGNQSPRIQFICDMVDPEQPYLIIAGGNGGSPLQMYYNNLMDQFENDKLIQFRNIDFNDEKNKERIISLEKRKI